MPRHRLSKSTFMRALQCSKSLYLYEHFKNLRDPISDNQQALFNRGHEVGSYAWKLFPEGVDGRAAPYYNLTNSLKKTNELIAKGVQTIFEATLQYDEVLVKVDILTYTKTGWVAYEVKSSTKVTNNQILDGALQYHVLSNSGFPIADFCIMHLNKSYYLNGELESEQLFISKSVLKEIKKEQAYVAYHIQRAKGILDKPTVPKVPIGVHCTSPYPCDFIGYCWQNVPEHSVFDLGYLSKQAKFNLYEKGIERIEELTEGHCFDKNVTIQINCVKQNKEYINQEGLNHFLQGLSYPIYFMDFEAIMPAIPIFQGTHPYQKIPFQYSLHYQEKENSALTHEEFLAKPGPDPRRAFIQKLLENTKAPGTILVFEDQLEKQILKDLKKEFPEHKEAINDRLGRIVDLRNPFKKLHYYHPAMNGAFSLKDIYKALVPNSDKSNTDIEHGGIASIIYEKLISGSYNEDPAKAQEQLLTYCQMDTFALHKVLEALKGKLKDSKFS